MKETTADIGSVWAQYIADRSDRLRNVLIEHYLPIVRHIATRIHSKLPREVELDDLVSAGTFGLMDAIAAFDPARQVKFETYCAPRIRGAILDELRACDWVPRLARLRSHKLIDATEQLRLELGREPSEDELAHRVGLPAAELQRMARDASVVRVLPLSGRRCPGGEAADSDPIALEDTRYEQRLRGIERQDLRDLITRGLSRAEQLIIILYYFEQMTMKEIGMTLDLSESRVSQMHTALLARLQGRLAERQRELEQAAA